MHGSSRLTLDAPGRHAPLAHSSIVPSALTGPRPQAAEAASSASTGRMERTGHGARRITFSVTLPIRA